MSRRADRQALFLRKSSRMRVCTLVPCCSLRFQGIARWDSKDRLKHSHETTTSESVDWSDPCGMMRAWDEVILILAFCWIWIIALPTSLNRWQSSRYHEHTWGLCCSLDLKCSPKAHAVKKWLWSYWEMVELLGSGACLRKLGYWSSLIDGNCGSPGASFPCPCFLASMMWTGFPLLMLLLGCGAISPHIPKTIELFVDWSLFNGTKANLSSFKWLISGILS